MLLREKYIVNSTKHIYWDLHKQLVSFSCRVCDAMKISERKNQTYSVMHQPPIMTLA